MAVRSDNSFKADLDTLHCKSRQGLWGLLIFLASSAAAYKFREFGLSSTLPANLMEQLGPTPDVILINIVLGVSTFCSLPFWLPVEQGNKNSPRHSSRPR